MMIDIRGLNTVGSKTGLNKSEKSKKQENHKTSSRSAVETDDSVELTGNTPKIQQLIQQMKSAPAVDLDRVSPIKEKLEKGEYSLNHQQIANKMLDFESTYYGY